MSLEKGADVNAMNADGITPLHDAIKRGDVESVEVLLKSGANVNIKAYKGLVLLVSLRVIVQMEVVMVICWSFTPSHLYFLIC